MGNQINTLPLNTSLLAKTLNARNPFQFVIETAQYYDTPTLAIINAFNNWNSEEINTEKYERGKIDNLAIAAAISTNTASGANLILTFSDPTYNEFRVGDEVMDNNRVHGWVSVASPGTITINPFGAALSSTTTFQPATTCRYLANQSPKRASVGVTSLQVTPSLDFNYYDIKRDSQFLANEDFVDTYVKFHGQNWAFSQEWFMLQRLCRSVASKFLWSNRAQVTTPQGLTNSNGGIEWSIKNRNGFYNPSSTAITLSSLNEFIYNIRIKKGKPMQELTFLCGSGALATIQNFLGEIMKFSGQNNTFGAGTVKGYNIKTYSIADVDCKFVYESALDNPGVWSQTPDDQTTISGLFGSKMSNSFFALDTSPATIVGGGQEPIIKLFHYRKEMSYGYINGMIDAGNDNVSENDYMNATSTLISSDVDGRSAHAIVRNGINIVDASGMGFWETIK